MSESSQNNTKNGKLLPCPFCSARVGSLYDTEAEAIAAWNTRTEYHGYEQAAIEAWESIKKWNTRAKRTCHNISLEKDWFECSECGTVNQLIWANYCPNCGARVIKSDQYL